MNTDTNPYKKHLIIIKILSVVLIVTAAILAYTIKEYITLSQNRSDIIKVVNEHEIDQLELNSKWFEQGCKVSFEMLNQESVAKGGDSSFELDLMVKKMSCTPAAKIVREELLKEYNKKNGEDNSAADITEKDSSEVNQ